MAEGGPQVYKPESYSSVWPLIITPKFSFIIILCPRVFREQRGVSVYRSLFTAQSVIHILRINYSIFSNLLLSAHLCVCFVVYPSVFAALAPFMISFSALCSFWPHVQWLFQRLGRCLSITWFTAACHSSDSQVWLKPFQNPTVTSAYLWSPTQSIYLFVCDQFI